MHYYESEEEVAAVLPQNCSPHRSSGVRIELMRSFEVRLEYGSNL